MNFIVTFDEENADLGQWVKYSMETIYDPQNVEFLSPDEIHQRNLTSDDVIINLDFDENYSCKRFLLDYIASSVDRKRGDIKYNVDRTQVRNDFWEKTAMDGTARVHVDEAIEHEEMNLKLYNIVPDLHQPEEAPEHHHEYFAALIQTIIHKRERQNELMMGKFYFGEFGGELYYANFMGDRRKTNAWNGKTKFVTSPSGRRSELKIELLKGMHKIGLGYATAHDSIQNLGISPDEPEEILGCLKDYGTQLIKETLVFLPPILIGVPHLNPIPNPNYPVFETGIAYGFKPKFQDIQKRHQLGHVARDENYFRKTATPEILEIFGF
jgi:hypothetical protein